METTSSLDQLAKISPAIVIIVVLGLTLIRLALLKIKDQWARIVSEACDTVNFVLILAFLVIRPFIAQSFYIPSQSMESTLLVNDRLIVDKISGRFKSVERNDVVVFEAPPEATDERVAGIDFIKRLIAVPGDTIQVKEAKITVNGETISESAGMPVHAYLRDRLGLSGTDSIKLFPDHLLINNRLSLTPQEVAEKLGVPGAKVTLTPGQTLLNGKVLDEPYTREDPDYNFPGGQWSYNVEKQEPDGSYRIPAGHYFMMGDNRNESKDSHMWGPLDKKSVVGKARVIFLPLNRAGWIR